MRNKTSLQPFTFFAVIIFFVFLSIPPLLSTSLRTITKHRVYSRFHPGIFHKHIIPRTISLRDGACIANIRFLRSTIIIGFTHIRPLAVNASEIQFNNIRVYTVNLFFCFPLIFGSTFLGPLSQRTIGISMSMARIISIISQIFPNAITHIDIRIIATCSIQTSHKGRPATTGKFCTNRSH